MSNRNPSLAISNGATPTGSAVDTFGGAFLQLYLNVTAVGATPTITVIAEASPDGSVWAAITTLTLTATAVGLSMIGKNEGHRMVRLRVSSNTNVTATAYLTVAGFVYGAWREN